MNTRILRIDPQHPDSTAIAEAAEILRSGGLVAFPTETVYGLGADATSAKAVSSIFEAKQRPLTDPIIVHIADYEALESVAKNIPPIVETLAQQFWPGALTLILERSEHIPPIVSANQPTVAVRMPAHPVAQALIRAANIPIAAPSANAFSRPSATTAAHALQDLDGRIDAVLDGGQTMIGVESTVLELSGKYPRILRPGGVSLEQLQILLPEVTIRTELIEMSAAAEAPGQLIKHYSPRAKVLLFPDEKSLPALIHAAQGRIAKGQRVGIIGLNGEMPAFSGLNIALFPLGVTLEDAARNLFAGLRALDEQQMDVILAHGYSRKGIGAAIWDRLLRAAEGKVQGS
ncbi:MAG: threonylcarbamoyl-AMP synthase [Anaerolineae bacterium]|nr:threonylcarbamoyl-AMP synthase [Anaerolineae bacterium]